MEYRTDRYQSQDGLQEQTNDYTFFQKLFLARWLIKGRSALDSITSNRIVCTSSHSQPRVSVGTAHQFSDPNRKASGCQEKKKFFFL